MENLLAYPKNPLLDLHFELIRRYRKALLNELLGGEIRHKNMEDLTKGQKNNLQANLEQEKTHNRKLLAEVIVDEFLNRLDCDETIEQVAYFVAKVQDGANWYRK